MVEKGNRYGYLTAVEYVRYDSSKRASVWLYRCDCGNERELEARAVTAGRIRTCGKCSLKHKLKPINRTSFRVLSGLYNRYLRESRKEKVNWALSIEEFTHKVLSNCEVCGEPPSQGIRGSRLIRYNNVLSAGINGEYTASSAVTCCRECEMILGKIGISKGIQKIFSIHKFQLDKITQK